MEQQQDANSKQNDSGEQPARACWSGHVSYCPEFPYGAAGGGGGAVVVGGEGGMAGGCGSTCPSRETIEEAR